MPKQPGTLTVFAHKSFLVHRDQLVNLSLLFCQVSSLPIQISLLKLVCSTGVNGINRKIWICDFPNNYTINGLVVRNMTDSARKGKGTRLALKARLVTRSQKSKTSTNYYIAHDKSCLQEFILVLFQFNLWFHSHVRNEFSFYISAWFWTNETELTNFSANSD